MNHLSAFSILELPPERQDNPRARLFKGDLNDNPRAVSWKPPSPQRGDFDRALSTQAELENYRAQR